MLFEEAAAPAAACCFLPRPIKLAAPLTKAGMGLLDMMPSPPMPCANPVLPPLPALVPAMSRAPRGPLPTAAAEPWMPAAGEERALLLPPHRYSASGLLERKSGRQEDAFLVFCVLDSVWQPGCPGKSKRPDSPWLHHRAKAAGHMLRGDGTCMQA